MRHVRTRSTQSIQQPYLLNEFPDDLIVELGKHLVYSKAIGRADISGDDFCRMFADSLGGEALGTPLGIADVLLDRCAWSVKTIKVKHPHSVLRIRLIGGRCSPTYSAGITDPLADLAATGQSVLDVYNQRIGQAQHQHYQVRLLVMVRNMEKREFTLYERALTVVAVNSYRWELNVNGNLQGYDGQQHAFTWQPHGSQLTILEDIPQSACRFKINRDPAVLDKASVLQATGFSADWIEVV